MRLVVSVVVIVLKCIEFNCIYVGNHEERGKKTISFRCSQQKLCSSDLRFKDGRVEHDERVFHGLNVDVGVIIARSTAVLISNATIWNWSDVKKDNNSAFRTLAEW